MGQSWGRSTGADSCQKITLDSNTITDNGYHGIGLIQHTSQCTIQNNESARNVYARDREANGIYMYNASNNVLRSNRWPRTASSVAEIKNGSAPISIRRVTAPGASLV